MLTSLLQFQSQGWEKWLSWIGFSWKDRLYTYSPIGIKSYPALELLSPGSGYELILT